MARDIEPGPPIEIIELDGSVEPPTRVSVGGGPDRRRGVAGLAVAAVVLVAALTAVGGGGDDGADDASAASTTTTERTSTTRRATTTTSPPVGPVVANAAGWYLLALDDRDAVAVDLASGTRTELDVNEPWAALPVAGGIVDLTSGRAFMRRLDGGEPIDLGRASQVLPTERADRVWLLARPVAGPGGDGTGGTALLVGLDGAVEAGPIPLPPALGGFDEFGGRGSGVVGTTRHLVLPATARAFRVGLDGGVEPLDGFQAGAPLSADEVIGTYCDEQARCSIAIVDLASGAVRELGVAGEFGWIDFRPARDPSSSRLAVLQWGPSPRVVVIDPEGGTMEEIASIGDIGSATWLPSGDLLIASFGDSIVRWSGGGLTEPLEGTDGLDASWIAVVPG